MSRLWSLFVVALGLLLTTLAWTPSSYGVVLTQLGAPGVGLIWGEPRPIRSDEFAVWTPLVQATVNNDHQRHNATSPYGEDLRNFNALPLHDWALPFKPAQWGLALPWDPARGFAGSWALPMVAFLLGWERLFRRLGTSPIAAIAASGTLWTTGYLQTWWTTTGPVLAAWPWVLLAALSTTRPALRIPLIAWTSVVCMLAHFYPPLLLTLALVGVAVLLVAGADRRRFGIAAAGVGLGMSLVIAYLWDVIPVMSDTIYPGQRISSGGGVPLRQVLDLVLPGLSAWRGESLLPGINVCEAATAGTLVPLLTCLALDRPRLQTLWRENPLWKHQVQILALLLTALLAWMTLPIPAWLGGPLGWHKVPPVRMVVPAGIVLLLLALRLPTRLPMGALVSAAWLWNLWHWSDFNPVQHAGPLFDPPRTSAIEALEAQAAQDPRGWLVLPGYGGAVLNGLGHSAISHALVAPKTDWFRPWFPDLSERDLREIFGRYAHIQLYGGETPQVTQQDVIRVPLSTFGPALKPLGIRLDPDWTEPLEAAGWIDRILIGDTVVITGWGKFDGTGEGRGLVIRSRWPVRSAQAEAMLRPDVAQATADPGLGASGFRLELELAGPAVGAICIATEDPVLGRHVLQQRGRIDPCRDVQRRTRHK